MYRRGMFGGWFGGPATRRLETGTRDAKTDVWMIWLQALSSVAILGLDLGLAYTWFLIVPREVIEIAGYLLAIVVTPVAAATALRMTLFGWGLYCRFILRVADPLEKRWTSLCSAAVLGTFVGMLILVPWDAAEWHWWSNIVKEEFPGRTWPLLHYILYGGACLSIWGGLATAWLRWWAKEIPDPVRPETEMGGESSLPHRKQELAEAKFAESQTRTAEIIERQQAQIASLAKQLAAMQKTQQERDKGM